MDNRKRKNNAEKLVGKIAMHLIKIPSIHFAHTVIMYQMVEKINAVLVGVKQI